MPPPVPKVKIAERGDFAFRQFLAVPCVGMDKNISARLFSSQRKRRNRVATRIHPVKEAQRSGFFDIAAAKAASGSKKERI